MKEGRVKEAGRKEEGMEGGRERWRGDRREEQGMGGGREAEKPGYLGRSPPAGEEPDPRPPSLAIFPRTAPDS